MVQKVPEIESDREGFFNFLNPVVLRDMTLWGAFLFGCGVGLATPTLLFYFMSSDLLIGKQIVSPVLIRARGFSLI